MKILIVTLMDTWMKQMKCTGEVVKVMMMEGMLMEGIRVWTMVETVMVTVATVGMVMVTAATVRWTYEYEQWRESRSWE